MFTRLTVTAALVVLLLVLAASGLACGDEATPDDFVGTWQEADAAPAHTMRIDEPQAGVFRVTYDRFYPSHGEFEFSDGELTYGPVTPDMIDVITYDADADTIAITSGASGESHTLARVTP